MGTLTIHRTYFLESEIHDGDIPRDDTWTDEYDVGASEAARILEFAGLSFAATGNTWAGQPDGADIVDYSTGRMVEVSGHLSGFPARVEAAIMARVG